MAGNHDVGTWAVVHSAVASARVASQLSQTQFAALMGVSVRTLQEWEQGRRQPSASNVSMLAERFGADNGRIARIILWTTVLAFLSFPLVARLTPLM